MDRLVASIILVARYPLACKYRGRSRNGQVTSMTTPAAKRGEVYQRREFARVLRVPTPVASSFEGDYGQGHPGGHAARPWPSRR
jgi:hypothetical protein